MEPIYMTPEGIERLREKLARLKRNLPKLAEETARTAAYGDRSDNAEYKQAKGALRYATYESYRIEDQLKRVVPIERGAGKGGIVQLGSTVTIAPAGTTPSGGGGKIAGKTAGVGKTKKETTYEILGPTETNPTSGRISHLSPLGAAMMGHKVGDIVAIQTATGKKEYTILKVS